MARYADIDKLIADGWHLERHGQSGRFLQSMSLADVQTADVVAVVRCKDCQYFKESEVTNSAYCDWHREYFETFANDYCSYGVRKGE